MSKEDVCSDVGPPIIILTGDWADDMKEILEYTYDFDDFDIEDVFIFCDVCKSELTEKYDYDCLCAFEP